MIFLVSSRRAEIVALSSSLTENFLEIRRALNLNSLIKLKIPARKCRLNI